MAAKTLTTRRYATVAEVADYTGLSEATIRNLLAMRELTAFRPVPGRIVLDLREVESFVQGSAGRQSTRGRKAHGIGIDRDSPRLLPKEGVPTSQLVTLSDLTDIGLTQEEIRALDPAPTEYRGLDGSPSWLSGDLVALLRGVDP
jgi:excisionase family DNA binding protein